MNRKFYHALLYAYSEMLEFPGQVLELNMPVGRGIKGPLGHLWVQAWTDNDYLNLILLALLDVVVQRSFSYGLGTPRRPSVNISCYLISSKTTSRIFLNLVRMFPSMSSCASTKKNSGPSTNMAAVGHLFFFLLDTT